jgi:16S rRNA (guanine(966)-N(2))-methyltransferase RsmD
MRGRRLETPSGFEVRPTSDHVKESIFNIIQFQVPGARALDLFSGTGQLGIEAISRGAQEVVFADNAEQALFLTRRNAESVGASERARFVRTDALRYLENTDKGSFDIVFLDPPYDTTLLEDALRRIIEFDILRESGIIICESRADKAMPDAEPPYAKRREYRYGKIKLTLYGRE